MLKMSHNATFSLSDHDIHVLFSQQLILWVSIKPVAKHIIPYLKADGEEIRSPLVPAGYTAQDIIDKFEDKRKQLREKVERELLQLGGIPIKRKSSSV